MIEVQKQNINTLFSSEQACVFYLFKKRWPWGFICPFCGIEQKEMAPAYTVVCRYCRKQTSITANTLMHGTKKSLSAWMKISWQFCFRDTGISAREVQRLMELASYQTAWRWLQKIRIGAAIAESASCRGNVLFDCASLPISPSSQQPGQDIGIAMELNHSMNNKGRVRFAVLSSQSPEVIGVTINSLVFKNATLLIRDQKWLSRSNLGDLYSYKQATSEQLNLGQLLIKETINWLNSTYRGAIDTSYLPTYLAEFSFHHNTASWPDRMAVLDHLLTGLVSSIDKKSTRQRKDRPITERRS